jgi:hypothetical protein
MTVSLIALCGLAVAAGQGPVTPTSIAPPDAALTAPAAATPSATMATPPATPVDPSKPTLLPSRTAIIDIDYDPTTRKSIQRVLLYVSRDQGQTWGLEATALPEQQSFTFAAKEDGLYWCIVQTVFVNGQKTPADVTRSQPDQRLFLDGTPPLVRIAAAKRTGDEVTVDWLVEEKYPDDANTAIRYKSADANNVNWVTVPNTWGAKRTATFPVNVPGAIVVEVIAKDLVGNPGMGRSEIGTIAVASGVTSPGPAGPPVKPVSNEQIVLPGGVVNGQGGTVPPPTIPPLATPPATIPTPAASNVIPTAEPQPVPVTTNESANAIPAIKPINVTRFDLSYSLTAGPAGISGIDLWVTRDEGKSWRKWSRHDGRESVIKVVLDTRDNPQVEGAYGFRLVPESGSRLADAAPTAGTPPEFRVVVDVSAPQIQVYEPAPHGERPDVVVLRWKATDTNFGKDPMAIEWSESQAGPWRAVNGGDAIAVVGGVNPAPPRLANTGEYAWRLPGDLTAPKVFLKFTSWDLAGNKAEAMTKDPILVDLTRPRASIRGIVGLPGSK